MLKTGDSVEIFRNPTEKEDPDNVWTEECDELIGESGKILLDICPLVQDSVYAHVKIFGLTDFFIPVAILRKL